MVTDKCFFFLWSTSKALPKMNLGQDKKAQRSISLCICSYWNNSFKSHCVLLDINAPCWNRYHSASLSLINVYNILLCLAMYDIWQKCHICCLSNATKTFIRSQPGKYRIKCLWPLKWLMKSSLWETHYTSLIETTKYVPVQYSYRCGLSPNKSDSLALH